MKWWKAKAIRSQSRARCRTAKPDVARWTPRTLRGQTLLLIVAAIIASQLITFAVLANFRHSFLGNRGRDYLASHVMLVRSALRNEAPNQLAEDLERSPGRRMRLVPTLPANSSPDPGVADIYSPNMIAQLRDDYGADAVRFTNEPLALWVQVSRNGWWLMMPSARFDVPIPWTVLYSTLAAVLVMAIIAALYSLQLSRPLRRLADAARNFEVGRRLQLPLLGPAEVRDVTSQFNAMGTRLADNDAERRVMLAGLPHDLRAPLARAKLRLALMDESEEISGLSRDLSEIERISDQFVAYLRGLDEDSRDFEPLDLGNLIAGRARAWQGAGQNVQLGAVDTAQVPGDADALERAVENLISNALAYGALPVEVSGRSVADKYRIEVSDAGNGIPEAMQSNALRPFVRLDASRGMANAPAPDSVSESVAHRAATAGGHCGLGLAVVQAVARLHGGTVEMVRKPGRFTVSMVIPQLHSATA
jgi:signal transduction histidine kinase